MRFSGKSWLWVIAVMMFCVIAGGGCTGGNGDSAKTGVSSAQVCVIGEPSGIFAQSINEGKTTDSLERLGEGDIVIIAGANELMKHADGIKAAYDRGAAVSIAEASIGDVQSMLRIVASEDNEIKDTISELNVRVELYAVAREGKDSYPKTFSVTVGEITGDKDIASSSEEEEANMLDEMSNWLNDETDEAHEEISAARVRVCAVYRRMVADWRAPRGIRYSYITKCYWR